MISTIIVLPTLKLNFILISVQRFFRKKWSIFIKFIKDIFYMLVLNLCFDFFVVYRRLPNILKWSEIVMIFCSRLWKFPCLVYSKNIIIYLDGSENSWKINLILNFIAWKFLISNITLHCRNLYQNINHLINSCIHLSFEYRTPYYNFSKLHNMRCFWNQKFDELTVVNNL